MRFFEFANNIREIGCRIAVSAAVAPHLRPFASLEKGLGDEVLNSPTTSHDSSVLAKKSAYVIVAFAILRGNCANLCHFCHEMSSPTMTTMKPIPPTIVAARRH
jgi:hypothetical protein